MATKKKQADFQALANFIYETGILSKTPRSGLWFLGTGQQSVAEHTLRTIFITYVLCHMHGKADTNRAVMLALFHDFAEGRTSDSNYIHQKYGRMDEAEAINDMAKTVPFGLSIKGFVKEAEAKLTIEAKLTKDADQLEWLATMREEETKGNIKAKVWGEIAYKRLKTDVAKKLGKYLLKVHPDAWWFDAKDEWWVSRRKPKK